MRQGLVAQRQATASLPAASTNPMGAEVSPWTSDSAWRYADESNKPGNVKFSFSAMQSTIVARVPTMQAKWNKLQPLVIVIVMEIQ
jgi:hypothetical protein